MPTGQLALTRTAEGLANPCRQCLGLIAEGRKAHAGIPTVRCSPPVRGDRADLPAQAPTLKRSISRWSTSPNIVGPTDRHSAASNSADRIRSCHASMTPDGNQGQLNGAVGGPLQRLVIRRPTVQVSDTERSKLARDARNARMASVTAEGLSTCASWDAAGISTRSAVGKKSCTRSVSSPIIDGLCAPVSSRVGAVMAPISAV